MLQNTPFDRLIGYAERWTKGETPFQTHFMALGRDDVQDVDRSHYNTVTELWGFLNLHRGPIFNNAARTAYESYVRPDDEGMLQSVGRVGEETRAFLQRHSGLVEELTKELATLRTTVEEDPRVMTMEGIGLTRVASQRPDDAQAQGDLRLRKQTAEGFDDYVVQLGNFDAVLGLLHLLLDAVLFKRRQAEDASAIIDLPPVGPKHASEPPRATPHLGLPPSLAFVAVNASSSTR